MRVISGKYKGNIIKGFDINGTRPTMDRVKESIFGTIQKNLKNSTVLDLFAGSGNLGIEAISNGSICTYFVDNNVVAINTIKENIINIKISEETHIMKADYLEAIKYFKNNNITFDIIFLDPPYKDKILNNLLDNLYELVNINGLVIIEYENDLDNNEKFNLEKTKKYSSKLVTFLRK
ncbi:MAG: 16S rRNA (guanine(966)-N(2))-methyltransferase RsmD [Bacilli bacterium]